MICNLADNTDTVPLASLLRFVQPTVPMLPYNLALDLVRESFKEFCRRTSCLSYIQVFDAQKDVSDYEFTPPSGYEVYQIVNDSDIIHLYGPDVWCSCGRYKYKVIGNKRIVVANIPTVDEVGGLSILVIVLPSNDLDVIPNEIATAYGKGIAANAIADALLYKNKPWFDPGLSQVFLRKFNIEIQSAKNLVAANRQTNNSKFRRVSWLRR